MPDLFFLVVGVILALIGALCLASQIKLTLSCSQKVAATVMSVQKKKWGFWRGKTLYRYFPTFTYQVGEKTLTAKCEYPLKRANKYKKGDEVVIRYNPRAAEKFSAGGSAFVGIFGFVLMAIGVFLAVCYFL